MADGEDIHALASHAASQWAEIIGPPELIMHRENSVFRVETTSGPHALRLHRLGYHNDEALISELAWMDMLAANGMNVPRPARTISGAFLGDTGGNKPRNASLLSWLSGAPLGKTGEQLALVGAERSQMFFGIGAEMAKMHKLADAWKTPAGYQRPRWDVEGLVGDNPFWGRFWELSFAPETDRIWLRALRDQCQEELVTFQNAGGNFGLIHADLVRENILVSEGAVSFIDFDDCGFGFRMFDIATALIKNIHEPDFVALRHALLAGYESIKALPLFEVEALPLFLTLRSLSYLGWAESRSSEPGTDVRAKRFLRDVRYVTRSWFKP
jgi:Ser/Thr protein kinase RdoA (MazF antagonist)